MQTEVIEAFNNSRMVGELFWQELPENEQHRFGRFAEALRTPTAVGEVEGRYRAETRSTDAIALDQARGEIFCTISESICWTGIEGAFARAKDIAEAFNALAQASPPEQEEQTG